MLAFLRFLRGYYKLHISGYSPERFMNLCRLNGIILWDIIPKEDYYCCKISLSDYPFISSFLQKTKVKADIQKEYGLPFFMRKNRKRKIFFSGVVISFVFIYGMSFFIWSFRFTGNEMIHDDILLRFVNSLGVGYGTFKKNIDIPMLEEEIREYFDGISWVSVKISGTRLIVSVKENEILSKRVEKEVTATDDLISGTKGMVCKMITRKGVPLVKVGDEVDIGTVLVEGKVPIFDNDGNIISYDYVNADADVVIRTQYPIHRRVSKYYRYKNYTGSEYVLPYIRFGQHYFCPIYKNNPYHLYEVIVNENTHSLLEEFSIPIFWGSRKYCEYVEIEDLYGDEEGTILLKQFLEQTIEELNEKGVQIIENNVKIETDSQYLKLSGDLVIDILQEDN